MGRVCFNKTQLKSEFALLIIYKSCLKGGYNMKRESGDSITFTDRSEVDNICHSLEIFVKEHPSDKSADDAKKMIEILEVMYVGW